MDMKHKITRIIHSECREDSGIWFYELEMDCPVQPLKTIVYNGELKEGEVFDPHFSNRKVFARLRPDREGRNCAEILVHGHSHEFKKLEAKNKRLMEWGSMASKFIDKSKESYDYSEACNIVNEFERITDTPEQKEPSDRAECPNPDCYHKHIPVEINGHIEFEPCPDCNGTGTDERS